LDIDLTLRIAPEIYLKECIAGGFNKVYEVSKCFRNEGMDPQHLQEFTQVEWYCAYWRYEDNIKFFTEFIQNAFQTVLGTQVIEYQGQKVDFSKKEWTRLNYCEKLKEICGFDPVLIEDPEELRSKLVENGLFSKDDLVDYHSVCQLIDFTYKKKIRESIVEPTIIYNYPAVLKPLARRNDEDKSRVDVFQVVTCGMELCNAYSELVNPLEQREAFEEQLKAKEQGDDETMDLDENYLMAMEHGMPPISGLGFGIDRLMMLMFDAPSVRDVVLFPLMREDK
jgi:lysyl-tRNA synthetase class 2